MLRITLPVNYQQQNLLLRIFMIIAREKFIEEGYDVTFGARPLKRLVGKTLEVDLSKMLIEEKSTLDEFQLRREKEIADLSDEKSKRQIVITTITPVIQEFFKLATKSKNLSDEEKKQLIILKWKLGKR